MSRPVYLGEVARDVRGHGIRTPSGTMWRGEGVRGLGNASPTGKAFTVSSMARQAFGGFQPGDVGRRVYLNGGEGWQFLTMESEEQRNARWAKAPPVTRGERAALFNPPPP